MFTPAWEIRQPCVAAFAEVGPFAVEPHAHNAVARPYDKRGERIVYANYTFEVLAIEERRISKVKVVLKTEPTQAPEE